MILINFILIVLFDKIFDTLIMIKLFNFPFPDEKRRKVDKENDSTFHENTMR